MKNLKDKLHDQVSMQIHDQVLAQVRWLVYVKVDWQVFNQVYRQTRINIMNKLDDEKVLNP